MLLSVVACHSWYAMLPCAWTVLSGKSKKQNEDDPLNMLDQDQFFNRVVRNCLKRFFFSIFIADIVYVLTV